MRVRVVSSDACRDSWGRDDGNGAVQNDASESSSESSCGQSLDGDEEDERETLGLPERLAGSVLASDGTHGASQATSTGSWSTVPLAQTPSPPGLGPRPDRPRHSRDRDSHSSSTHGEGGHRGADMAKCQTEHRTWAGERQKELDNGNMNGAFSQFIWIGRGWSGSRSFSFLFQSRSYQGWRCRIGPESTTPDIGKRD